MVEINRAMVKKKPCLEGMMMMQLAKQWMGVAMRLLVVMVVVMVMVVVVVVVVLLLLLAPTKRTDVANVTPPARNHIHRL